MYVSSKSMAYTLDFVYNLSPRHSAGGFWRHDSPHCGILTVTDITSCIYHVKLGISSESPFDFGFGSFRSGIYRTILSETV